MANRNCWEAKGCGREPGGKNAGQLGICPAATEARLNGVNRGRNGGRACWPIAGTLCGGKVQGTFAAKVQNCFSCDFYQTVAREEGVDFVKAKDILKRIT